MDIGILGADRFGGTLVQLLVESNHEMVIVNNNGVESLEDLSETLGPQLCPVEPKQTVRFGDVVSLVIPFRERDSLPDAIRLAEKIMVDVMNPYTENFRAIGLDGDTPSELVASQLPDARLVKSFNTIHWKTFRGLGHPGLPEFEYLAVFLAGDDSDAKACVTGLIRDIGFGLVDVGSLASGGELLKPGSALYKRKVTVEEV